MFEPNLTSLLTDEVGVLPETMGKGLWPITLYHTKICNFPYPISEGLKDKKSKEEDEFTKVKDHRPLV